MTIKKSGGWWQQWLPRRKHRVGTTKKPQMEQQASSRYILGGDAQPFVAVPEEETHGPTKKTNLILPK